MRYKWIGLVFLVGILALIMAPTPGQTQFPGGGGGRGNGGGGGFPGGGGGGFPGGGGNRGGGGGRSGMGMDPAQIFDFLAKGRGFFLISETSRLREPLTQWAQQNGINGDQITRDQFVAFSQQQQGLRGGGGGGAPPAASPGGAPGGPSPDSGGGWGGRGNWGGGGGDRGGWGGNPDSWAEGMFRRLDANGDGLLNFDEMPEALRTERDKYDEDRDGFVDAREFKAYFSARIEQMQMQNGNGGQSGEDEDKKPTVYRAGNLPKELPQWFAQLDSNTDAQIGLYEWRGNRPIEEFEKYDVNNDGFITVQEVLRVQNVKQGSATASAQNGGQGRGNWMGGGGFGGGNGGGFGGGNGGGFRGGNGNGGGGGFGGGNGGFRGANPGGTPGAAGMPGGGGFRGGFGGGNGGGGFGGGNGGFGGGGFRGGNGNGGGGGGQRGQRSGN